MVEQTNSQSPNVAVTTAEPLLARLRREYVEAIARAKELKQRAHEAAEEVSQAHLEQKRTEANCIQALSTEAQQARETLAKAAERTRECAIASTLDSHEGKLTSLRRKLAELVGEAV